MLPSTLYYTGKDFLNHFSLTGGKTLLWHVGITEVTKEMEESILNNSHTLLVEDASLRKKYQEYLNIDYIPEEYKKEKPYYIGYNNEKMQKFVYPKKLDESSILKRDKPLAQAISGLLSVEGSPGLADDEVLKRLPKAYFVISEWDAIKDQALIYAGRLRSNGVPVEIAFYETGFHGIASFINEKTGYKVARDMLSGIVDFIKINI